LDRELILPNLHVSLVHFPLGIFLVGLVMELLGVMWRRHPARDVGRWMILIGGLCLLPAALSGVYAYHDVATANLDGPVTWAEKVAASSLDAEQWRQLFWHTWLMSIATGLIVVTIVAYLAMSDRMRRILYLPTLGLLIIGAGLMSSGAWFAGEAIYEFGVGVHVAGVAPTGVPSTAPAARDNADQSRGMIDKINTARPPSSAAATADDASKSASVIDKINTAVPPLQPHVILAGLAIALALAAVGLSIRQITCVVPTPPMDEADALLHSLTPATMETPIYPGRFWLAASICFVLTAAVGWYVFASGADEYNPKLLWQMVTNPDENNGFWLTRGVAHVILAGTLVILPLVMAALARWAPKQRWLLALFTLLLTLAIASQLWIGILLLFDDSGGSVRHFN
jgi:uncharacterized membrane protein